MTLWFYYQKQDEPIFSLHSPATANSQKSKRTLSRMKQYMTDPILFPGLLRSDYIQWSTVVYHSFFAAKMAKRPHHTLSIIESNQIYGRRLAACEAAWKCPAFQFIYGNPLLKVFISTRKTKTLCEGNEELPQISTVPKLREWLALDIGNSTARNFTYHDIPKYY